MYPIKEKRLCYLFRKKRYHCISRLYLLIKILASNFTTNWDFFQKIWIVPELFTHRVQRGKKLFQQSDWKKKKKKKTAILIVAFHKKHYFAHEYLLNGNLVVINYLSTWGFLCFMAVIWIWKKSGGHDKHLEESFVWREIQAKMFRLTSDLQMHFPVISTPCIWNFSQTIVA